MSNRPRTPHPRLVWATGWTSFFADAATEMIYGLLPALYLGTLSLGVVWLGLVEGAAEALVSITKLFSGALSDRSGRRKSWMLAGYGLSALARPLLALAGSGLTVAGLRALDRLGKGIRGAPRDALLASGVATERRAAAFGIQRSMDHAGALVGGGVAAALLFLGWAGPRELFLLTVIPGAACLLTILFWIPADPTPGARVADRRVVPLAPHRAWRDADPILRRFLMVSGLFALANSSDMLLLALAYTRFIAAGWAESTALGLLPLLWALLHVVRSVGTPLGGRLSDAVGRRNPLAAAWGVYAVVYAGAALFSIGGHPAWAFAVFGGYGVFTALAEAPARAMVADLQPIAELRGTAFGLLHFVRGLLVLPATVLAAILWQAYGSFWAFAVSAGIAALAAVALRVSVPAR